MPRLSRCKVVGDKYVQTDESLPELLCLVERVVGVMLVP